MLQIEIDPALLERFGRTMREHFTTGSVPFRKAYMQSLIDVIEVDDRQIPIKGSKDVLEKAVLASQKGQADCSQIVPSGAPEGIRTPDPQIRSLVLYPAELPALWSILFNCSAGA